jgi:hypothetical protein
MVIRFLIIQKLSRIPILRDYFSEVILSKHKTEQNDKTLAVWLYGCRDPKKVEKFCPRVQKPEKLATQLLSPPPPSPTGWEPLGLHVNAMPLRIYSDLRLVADGTLDVFSNGK